MENSRQLFVFVLIAITDMRRVEHTRQKTHAAATSMSHIEKRDMRREKTHELACESQKQSGKR